MLSSSISSFSTLFGMCPSIKFLWVITLLELTNSSGMTTLEISLIGIEGVGTEGAGTEGVGIENTFVKGVYTKSNCSNSTCI